MVIRKSDRVSTVLRSDESLIEVFVALSPAFERLRNPAMRKVMSRLVTIEQAARMASVDVDELVSRLNEGGAGVDVSEPRSPCVADEADASESSHGGAAACPAALEKIPADARVELDVREDLRNGQEPFSRIMAAHRDVPPGGAIRVRAIFEPVPLYAVMAKQGLAHHTEQLGPEDWSVWFYPAEQENGAGRGSDPGDAAVPGAAPEKGNASGRAGAAGGAHEGDEGDDGVVVLDVRGLEPPEPMVRTLAALEALPPGGTLVQLNVRVPQFLLPQLEERGFAYDIREQSPELVRMIITRK